MDAPNSGKRTRSVHADLNLVPYIDLLTCMVAFLLITAVWTQLTRLKVAQSRNRENGPSDIPIPPVVVNLHADGFSIVHGQNTQTLAKQGGQYDYQGLQLALLSMKAKMPDRNDATLASGDDIPFDTIVHTMDTMIGAQFPLVSLEEQAGR